MNTKKTYLFAASFLVIGGIFGFHYYQKIFAESVLKNGVIFIKQDDNLSAVKSSLKPYIENIDHFNFVAKKKNFISPKGGRYSITQGMSNNDIVNLLRSGNQTPIKVSFNNQDTLEKLVGRISKQIEADSISLLNTIKEPSFLRKNNFTTVSVLEMFLPNTYEFYWNTTAKAFRDKMFREYTYFWNKDRLEKCRKINVSKNQVMVLASIVQKETTKKSERPIVAGLYLNRYKKGWPLQADPTIIYAKKQIDKDIVIKRVLTKYIEETKNSPYNTYTHRGLPPTVIAMPDISSIDAVLNATRHNYFFMCASIDKIGYHEFAKTLAEHNRNAAKYQRWITAQGINR